MATSISALQQARPAAPFSRSSASRRLQQRRLAAVPVRAEVNTTDRGLTSGVQINGMRPTSPKAWAVMSTALKKGGVTFVDASAAEGLVRRGVPVIDIRPSSEFSKGRLPGSTNVQYFQLIEGWSPDKIVRRLGFTFFGVVGTEANPDFVEEVAAVARKKNAGCIVVCNIGGSLKPTGPSEFGRQSRSLTAAYELLQAGFSNIKVLENGYSGWLKAGKDEERD